MKQSIGAERGISIRESLGSCPHLSEQGCYCCHFCNIIVVSSQPPLQQAVAFIESKQTPKPTLEHLFLCEQSRVTEFGIIIRTQVLISKLNRQVSAPLTCTSCHSVLGGDRMVQRCLVSKFLFKFGGLACTHGYAHIGCNTATKLNCGVSIEVTSTTPHCDDTLILQRLPPPVVGW